jgi:hypothetical protein
MTSKKDETQLMTIDFEAEAGVGFENADADAYAVPFLKILQKLSPQVDDDSEAYVEGAKAGMFFNTATGKLYDAVKFVPINYNRTFLEWKPREEGGGFAGKHAPSDTTVRAASHNGEGKLTSSTGNYLADTREHMIMIINDDGSFDPALFALASSGIKASRKLMTSLNAVKMDGKNGKFSPPMYANLVTANGLSLSNDNGSWKSVEFKLDGFVSNKDTFDSAKSLYDSVSSGEKGASYETSEDIPF